MRNISCRLPFFLLLKDNESTFFLFGHKKQKKKGGESCAKSTLGSIVSNKKDI